ncbi:MAG TPA: LacI family DNA-binding transcriptional regulator [Jatrophihabitantaceae bacterium]|jgi:LacI family transcriptional regulator
MNTSAPSVKDVARRAGVSLGTVSNVLNRPDTVRASTRARVEQAIAELGFVRNEPARALRGGNSRMIAYLALDLTNPFFADITRGIEEVARAHGLGLLLCSSDNDRARELEYLALLTEQRIRGLLVTAIDYGSDALHHLLDRGFPVVFVDRPANLEHRCTVGVDDVDGGDLAVSHLLDNGHRSIGFIGGPPAIPQVADRLAGSRQAVATAGLPAETLTVLETRELNVAEGRRAGARVLGLPKRRRPTAVFCANDLLALGVLQEMTLQAVAVPDELAIVGYDDIEFASAAAIPLTSVRQPRHQLGRAAAELLIDEALQGSSHEHRQTLYTPELIVRASSRRGVRSRRAG